MGDFGDFVAFLKTFGILCFFGFWCVLADLGSIIFDGMCGFFWELLCCLLVLWQVFGDVVGSLEFWWMSVVGRNRSYTRAV